MPDVFSDFLRRTGRREMKRTREGRLHSMPGSPETWEEAEDRVGLATVGAWFVGLVVVANMLYVAYLIAQRIL